MPLLPHFMQVLKNPFIISPQREQTEVYDCFFAAAITLMLDTRSYANGSITLLFLPHIEPLLLGSTRGKTTYPSAVRLPTTWIHH